MISNTENDVTSKSKKKHSLVLSYLLTAIIFIVLFTTVLMVTQCRGNDMYPSVKEGDLLFANRLAKPQCGDVVIYEYEQSDRLLVGRVAACGGSEIDIYGGVVKVDSLISDTDVIYETEPGSEIDYPFQVPEGSYFILGDKRNDAVDSRTFGAISEDQIKGRVFNLMRRRTI